MSVDYRSGIAKGYIVTQEEMKVAAEKANMDEAELTELLSDDYNMLIYLNTWAGGDYILGFDISYCEDGCAEYIDEINISAERSVAVMMIYKQYFGNGIAPTPRLINYLAVN